MAKTVMLMGTSSHVGKSIITTALCRIFQQQGQKVIPFKAQNMALNSYVTKEGLEMGRAQVAQAEAAGLEPMVVMNPVLLKPTGNSCSQVIINGKPVGNMSAREYHKGYSLQAFSAVKAALNKITTEYETVVIEGAGSPAEVNLKANDIVNMRVAKYLQAPVLLIADIDRGGALAALVGTLELLDDDERELVKGLIINKFRGDVSLLTPAIDFLEAKTGKPVLGVVPHIEKLGIDDEDSVSLEEKQNTALDKPINIAVIQTPKLSNFTDFDSLAAEPDVSLYYVQDKADLKNPDMIILPGSKNTTEDLAYIRKSGIEEAIQKLVAKGTVLFGICGGYQMLGKAIYDPHNVESKQKEICGLGYLAMETTFASEKLTAQVEAECIKLPLKNGIINAKNIAGYEIHMGKSSFAATVKHPFVVKGETLPQREMFDGAYSTYGQGEIIGTYIHGVFDNDDFRRQVLNELRAVKGLTKLPVQINIKMQKERAYNNLAEVVRTNLDMEKLTKIMGAK